MFPSLRRITRRIAAVGPGIVDTFLRDNKVLPPILALLALLVFAWVVAGTFVGDPGGDRVTNQANVAQSQSAQDPLAPEAENRDVDSYAAYRNKDPFRQLLAPAESTSDQPAEETTAPPVEETAVPDDTGGSTTGGATAGAQDTDGDGLTDTREAELAQDPQNPDTDGDGILDGADDADGDGQPDGQASGGSDASASPSPDASARPDADSSGAGNNGGTSGADAGRPPADGSAPASDGASGGGAGRGTRGGGGDRGDGRRGDDLLDSGGILYAP